MRGGRSFSRAWGPDFDQKGGGRGGGGGRGRVGQVNLCVETNFFFVGERGGVSREVPGARGEGFRSHRCRVLLSAWCLV